MSRNYGVDLFRLIACFFIMCLHTNYGKLKPEYVEIIRLSGRWAVPFFFMATGFFLEKKLKNTSELNLINIQINLINLISILIISSIIYLPVNFLTNSFPNNISNLLTGTYVHLWFIGSLLFGYISIWYFYFIKKTLFLHVLSVAVLIFGVISNSYDLFIGRDISIELGRFMLSIPFINIGMLISKRRHFFKYNFILISLVLIGFIIQHKEANMFYDLFKYSKFNHEFLIGTLIISIPLFILSVRINIRENIFSIWGSRYSLFIYLYHPLIYLIINFIFKQLFQNECNTIRMFNPIIGFAVTLISAILLRKYLKLIFIILNGSLTNGVIGGER